MPKPAKRKLAECDLENLRESGLSDATISNAKLYTANDALVFPYRDAEGVFNCYKRTRPHKPRMVKGKPVKYESPKGKSNRLYFTGGTYDDPLQMVYITEGEKCALALNQLGLNAIGLTGVYGWKVKGKEQLIPDFDEVALDGQQIVIVFDYDPKPETQRKVDKAKHRLAALLKQRGAAVLEINLPPAKGGGKQGIDDYLAAMKKPHLGNLGIKVIKIINNPPKPAKPKKPNKVIKLISPTLKPPAYHGLIGDFLQGVSPLTEATEPAMLAHLLPAIGMLVGPKPHTHSGGRQPARLNSVVVGPSGTGRKGTASGIIANMMKAVDEEFWNNQHVSGLSSGEGLINKLADYWETDKDGNKEKITVEKRLFVLEPEFSRVLAQIRREGNILSQIVRDAYDSGDLCTLTVNARVANATHVAIVGHITPEELAQRFNHIEMANGFGNRFMWFYTKSENMIVDLEPIPDEHTQPMEKRLRTLYDKANKLKRPMRVKLTKQAKELWHHIYEETWEEKPGMVGCMTARNSVAIMRSALVYCLFDTWKNKAPTMNLKHLEAGQAVCQYSQATVEQLFDNTVYDPLAVRALELLANGPLTRSDFNRHLSKAQKEALNDVLQSLAEQNLVECQVLQSGKAGRPAELWQLI